MKAILLFLYSLVAIGAIIIFTLFAAQQPILALTFLIIFAVALIGLIQSKK